ncbi:hypothetical protein, partial [Seonamhaeicola sp.]|uniref:hypothetical protein n=1 Tax=Seonamhaeicola sp. TaxID=1912245 RepID=UPI0035673C68
AKENGGGENIISANIYIKNPVDLTTQGVFTKKKQAPSLVEILTGEIMSEDDALVYLDESLDLGNFSEFKAEIETKKGKDIFIKNGFDGVISDFGNNNMEYVIFEPEQAKILNQTAKKNESTPPNNTNPNADLRPNIEPNIQQGKDNQVQAAVEPATSKGEVKIEDQINHAVKEVKKGVLSWGGNSFSPRIDLGISRADVRKGEADIKKGKYNTVPAKRVIEALAKAKERAYYDYIQGSGAKIEKIQVPLTEQLDAETEFSLQELEEINKNEEQLANDYNNWIDTLDDNTINEIYENNSREKGVVEKPTEIGESKNDVQDKQGQSQKQAKDLKSIFEQGNIKEQLDFLDSLKLDTNNLKSTLPFAPQVWNAFIEALKVGLKTTNSIQKAIAYAIDKLKKDGVDVKDIDAVVQKFAKDQNIKVDDNSAKNTVEPKEKKTSKSKKQGKISERFLKGDNKELVDALIESLHLNNKNTNQGTLDKLASKIGFVEYETRRQETVYNNAVKFIDKVGVFAAFDAITSGKIKQDDTKNAIYAIILERQAKEIINISETIKGEDNIAESLLELSDFFDKVFESYTLATVNAGQGMSMINFLHKRGHFVKYDLSNQIALERQRNGGDISNERLIELRKRDELIKKQDARIKELEALQEKQIAQENFNRAIEFEDLEKNKSNKPRRKRRKLSKEKTDKQKELLNIIKKRYFAAANDITRIATMIADPDVLNYLAITLEKAGGDFLNFSEDVIEAFGKSIKKHIPEMYKKAGGKEDTTLYDTTPETIKVKDGKIIISRTVLRELVEEGITDIDVAAETLRSRNMELLEDFTLREVRDALTEYGKTRELDKSEVATTVRKLKRLGVLLSKMDDAKQGIRPSRTGLLRDPSTPLEREYNKLLNDLLDKLPVDQVDLDRKIKTALDKRETTLKNAIEELQLQIDNKKRVERTVKERNTNDEIDRLEAIKKAKQEELTAIVGVPVKSLEQKLQTRKNQIDSQIKKLEDDLSNNNIGFKEKTTPVTDAEIEQKLKRLNELKAQRQELRETQGLVYKQRLDARKNAVKRAIEERKNRLRDGNFAKRQIKPLKEDAELKTLKRENLRLKEKFELEAEKDRLSKRGFLEKVKDAGVGALNSFRAFLLTAEMSFIGIQGFVLMTDKTITRRNIRNLRNKSKTVKKSDFKTLKSTAKASVDILKSIESFKTMHETLGSTFSAAEHKNSELDLKNHPYYEMAKKYVQLVELNTGLQDEHFVGMDFINDAANIVITQPTQIAEKIIRKKLNKLKPELSLDEQTTVIADALVKLNLLSALERANSRFLNEIRLQEFMIGVEALELSGKSEETHPQDYKALGMMVNTVTGTASLGPLLKQST